MDVECFPMCRVCMQKSPEFFDFDMPLQDENEEDTSITYLDFFFECTRIEVEPHEGASQCFCLPCGDELRSFYKFFKIAEMTDRLLKAKHHPFSGSTGCRGNYSTSYKINKLGHKNVCVLDEEELCTNENTKEALTSSKKDVLNYHLENAKHQKAVEKHRLVELRVDILAEAKIEHKNDLKAELSASSIDENNSSSELKSTKENKRETKKLNRKKYKKGPAECAFCHEILRNQKLLDRHLVEEHQRRTKPCEICGTMVIRMRDHLLIHDREKHSIKRPKTECPICFRMISKQTISRHIRHVHQRRHDELKKQKCSECSQIFADSHKLKMHIFKGHTSGVKIKKCPLCSRTFSNQISLNNHLRIHPCLERYFSK